MNISPSAAASSRAASIDSSTSAPTCRTSAPNAPTASSFEIAAPRGMNTTQRTPSFRAA